MNFKGHITGGIVSGTILASATFLLKDFFGGADPLQSVLSIFGITVFFSLFPDVDIGSVLQRWFYRAIFIILLYLGYQKQYELATLIAIIALTPILHHHRGWTHSYIAAFFVPVSLACLYEYILIKDHQSYTWSTRQIYGYMQDHMWVIIACIFGWCTHLLLDSQIPFFKNDRGHQ
ncbi:MAG: hypothetical protein E3K32_03895 [wastewater metagenome]|nr:hypothetical protein [Candidatus Loosdrechtia aerotolerans]